MPSVCNLLNNENIYLIAGVAVHDNLLLIRLKKDDDNCRTRGKAYPLERQGWSN